MTPRSHEVVYGCLWYLYSYSEPLTMVIFHSYMAVYQRVSHMLLLKSVTSWWYTYPSEKYDFVSWDDEIPN